MSYIPRQGDIIKMNFNPTRGHEQMGCSRPAVVVSNADYIANAHKKRELAMAL